ncbi:Pentatricopeptide repeat-containing protein [Apostasia shenzhenica]|uniref:Pentatricopeptide repeat-containing protein n=1 Tax=Apostasia shenzhenica TaxID=1088818 RepID=A0A2I0ABT7_9ASPA|nr:Pentatricopeptide repeat-containing protein [Apostasia shenzhenica]
MTLPVRFIFSNRVNKSFLGFSGRKASLLALLFGARRYSSVEGRSPGGGEEGEETHGEIPSFCSRERNLLSLFLPCSAMRELSQIHALIIRSGFVQHVFVSGRLISFCAVSELGSMDYAAAAFEEISSPDAFIYNTMIRGFVRTDRGEEALSCFRKMRQSGKLADNFTFSFLLKLCGRSAQVELGRQIHCSIVKNGYVFHSFVLNTLLHMYAMFKHIVTAHRLFDEMPVKDLVSWNVLIDGLVHCEQYNEALRAFVRMQQWGFAPDAITFVEVLCACAELGDLTFGQWVHAKLSSRMLDDFIFLPNSLIVMYSKCGALDKALKVFDEMTQRNRVSWNSMILALAMHGRAREALQLFSRMRENVSYEPDDITFLGVLCACSHGGLVEEGKRYFAIMRKDYGINPSVKHYGCMVDLLGRAGLLKEAYELVSTTPMGGNAVLWRTLLGACRVHGELEMGEWVRKHLGDLEPNHSGDFVLLSHMYAMVGRWKEVVDVREEMMGRGVKKPSPGNSLIDYVHNSSKQEVDQLHSEPEQSHFT